MAADSKPGALRVFKAKVFSRDARKTHIGDTELCRAAADLNIRQGNDLGGNVWKKRLNRNMHRAIVLLSPRRFWLFVYLYAKKDREDIDEDELAGFKKLAKNVSKIDDARLAELVRNGDFVEICDESEESEDTAS